MIQQLHSSKKFKANSQIGICTSMYIVALFTIAKWKQAKCPSVDEWLSKTSHIHIMELLFSLKKE